MINDNKDNLKDNQEQEIENQIEESTVEENSENTATNDIVVDDDKEESTSTKKASKKNDMMNYLDKSIINIKQYEYDELDNIVESQSNDNSEIYESGLDKKEKDGPPFSVSIDEILKYTSDRFKVLENYFSSKSIEPRKGSEKVLIFEKI